MKISRIAILFAVIGLSLGGTSAPAQADYTSAVGIGSASEYSVLAGSTVTNTGSTILSRSLGLSPGTSVTGFPPGTVDAPAVMDVTNAAAGQAQADLTGGYIDAAGRPLTGTVPADLAGQTLQSGVYAASGKGPLSLGGTVVLDGGGNTDAVFIFQTDSTLTTASGASVSLIGGAQACRVYWLVGSSATIGTGSAFVGTVLAQESITVTSGASVRGRVLARTGAVTLDSNIFSPASCQPPVTPPAPPTVPPSVPPAVPPADVPTPEPPVTAPPEGLPKTGRASRSLLVVAGLFVGAGFCATLTRRRVVV